MAYLFFHNFKVNDILKAGNPEYLIVNSLGTNSSSTISNLNTRKYHGVLVSAQPQLDNDNHVLLSNLDEIIKTKEQEVCLAFHQYPIRT